MALPRLAKARVSMPIVQRLAALAAVAAIPVAFQTDPDYWWHYVTGREVVTAGIPRTDDFSWTAGGEPWVAHEWLSEALIYLLSHFLGYWANLLVFGLIFAATFVLACRIAEQKGASPFVANVAMLPALVPMIWFVTVRPQVFSWFFFALFAYVIDSHITGKNGKLAWSLPLIMLAWVNLHLGFTIALLPLSAWIGVVILRLLRGQRVPSDVAVIVACCCITTLLNPHGYHLLEYPLRYWHDREATSFIGEWHRPDPLRPLHWPIFIAIVLTLVPLTSRFRPAPFFTAMSLMVVALNLIAIRNTPFVAIMLPIVLGPAITQYEPFRPLAQLRSKTRVPFGVAAAAVVCAIAATAAIGGSRTGALALREASSYRYPKGGAEFIDQNLEGERIFNDYGWGGYLIFELYPQTRVFIDGRSDLYRTRRIETYLTIVRVNDGWDTELDSLGIKAIIIPRDSRLARALRTRGSSWREAYVGSLESVFTRNSPTSPAADRNSK
jgi:hypothetical protein